LIDDQGSRGQVKSMPQNIPELHSENQQAIFHILDIVVKTGVPVEYERKGKRLLISPADKYRDLNCLENHPRVYYWKSG
jgi:hypothetical protein